MCVVSNTHFCGRFTFLQLLFYCTCHIATSKAGMGKQLRYVKQWMKTPSERCGLAKVYVLSRMFVWWFDIMKICLVPSDVDVYCLSCTLHVKRNGDYLYSDFDLFWDLMTLTLTFDLQNQSGSVLSQDAPMCQIWWKLCRSVRAFCVMFQPDEQTHPQNNLKRIYCCQNANFGKNGTEG